MKNIQDWLLSYSYTVIGKSFANVKLVREIDYESAKKKLEAHIAMIPSATNIVIGNATIE